MPKKNKVLSILCIMAIGVLLSGYFYSQLIGTEVPIHSDDAGTATDMRDVIEMGTAGWKYWIRPLTMLNRLVYMLAGPSELFLQVFFALKYGICISLTLYLALYFKKKFMWWLLPFFIFFCLPGNFGTASIQPLKFHVWTQMVPLICLVYILAKGNDLHLLKKKDFLMIFCLSVFGLIERDILVVVTCWLPLLLYAVIYVWQKGAIKWYRNCILAFSMLALLFGKAFFSNIEYQGYGASRFIGIEDLGNNLVVGITGFLSMFNIDLIGSNVLQFQTIICGIRLLVLGYALWCVADMIRGIFVSKIENVDMVNAILAISVVVLLVVYLFGGMREDAISIRYMAYSYYALLVVSCRKACERWDQEQFLIGRNRYRVNVLSCFFVICIAVTMNRVSFQREENDADRLAEQIQKMDHIECGMGSFWTAGVTSCLTNYETEVQAGERNLHGRIVPYLSKWDSYCSGNRFYNFFLEDCERGDFGITAKNLLDHYGIYQEKYELDNANVYVYDYDIRTAPLIIHTGSRGYFENYDDLIIENNSIQLKQNKYIELGNLYVSVGKIRMSVYGKLAENALAVDLGESAHIQMAEKTKNKAVYEITADKLYENLKIKIFNKSTDACEIKTITMERLQNSISLPNDKKQTLELMPGYYIFGIEGEQVKNSTMLFEANGEECYAERINHGTNKVAYGIQVPKQEKVNVVIEKKGTVSEVYYQNEIRSSFDHPNKKIYTINDGIQVKKATGLLYGPYDSLEPGIYEVDIYGNNLENAEIRFTCDGGTPLEHAMLIQKDQDHLLYRIQLDENKELFEVLISGSGNKDCKVYYYTLTSVEKDSLKMVDLIYDCYDPSIHTSSENKKENEVLLQKNDVCYGPYINLPAGNYRLELFGSNLADAEVAVTYQNGEQTVHNLKKHNRTATKSEMEFVLEESAENIEVVIRNNQDHAVSIKSYNIQSWE